MHPIHYATPAWQLGFDLGQRQDYSALSTLEIFWTYQGRDPYSFAHVYRPTLNVCGLTRYPLGTSYAAYPVIVANRLARIRQSRSAGLPFAPGTIAMAIDAGGPGGPLVDLLRDAKLDVALFPLLITGGDSPGYAANGYRTVPRRDLLTNLAVLLDFDILMWPEALPNRRLLEEEIMSLAGANGQPGVPGAHDDLVMSIAIAAWIAKVRFPQIMPKETAKNVRHWTPHGSLF